MDHPEAPLEGNLRKMVDSIRKRIEEKEAKEVKVSDVSGKFW